MKELAHANKLYKEKIVEKKREKQSREKVVREQAKAEERAAIKERKAGTKRTKEERDTGRALELSQRGKHKISQAAAPRKKQNRSATAAHSQPVVR